MRLMSLSLAVALVACASGRVGNEEPSVPATSSEAPARPASREPSLRVVAAEPLDVSALPWRQPEALARVRDADRWLQAGEPSRALIALGDDATPTASLLQARAWRMLGKPERALAVIEPAASDPELAVHAALERGLAAWERQEARAAVADLLPLLTAGRSIAEQAALPLCDALVEHAPETLLERAVEIEEILPPARDNLDARSLWLAAQARALEKLDRVDEARAVHLRRFLEEPVSLATPLEPPDGTAPTPEQLLARAEVLLEAHRNERVIEALEDVPDDLTEEQACRRAFALGLASRKLRLYADAEKNLTRVVASCTDEELARRAMYLNAKVISIRDGLRAVPVIEAFAKRFAGHTMVDDVLFWAGDMYQRRTKWAAASVYYRRIESLPEKDDYCGEARWRIAWMAYRRGRLKTAMTGLGAIVEEDGCAPARYDRARARYWMARIHETGGHKRAAAQAYRATHDIEPLGFYGQMALARLVSLDEAAATEVIASLEPPKAGTVPLLCPGFLAGEPAFVRGIRLMLRGLDSDAAKELLSIAAPGQEVLGTSHAVNLGLQAKHAEAVAMETPTAARCPPAHALLLLALLLDRTGAHRDAHWRLRTDFADTLARRPTAADGAVWHAAYPLAFRQQIAPAEEAVGLPHLFLQALSREESALDPQVVSWAGAYGLTQLLLTSGQAAGKLLDPPIAVTRAEELLDPGINARLGAALLASEMETLGNNLALGLAAYNAGRKVALTWWKRHQGEPFDVFAEEMTIKETRGYVKRVLKTFGIYRWLYAQEPPILPVELMLPER